MPQSVIFSKEFIRHSHRSKLEFFIENISKKIFRAFKDFWSLYKGFSRQKCQGHADPPMFVFKKIFPKSI